MVKNDTRWQYQKKLCRFCKTENEPLLKSTKSKSGRQYYSCRNCNTRKLKLYRSTKEGRLATSRASKKAYNKNIHKSRAREYIAFLLRNKEIVKPKECSRCMEIKRIIDAHHPDYSKPGEVIWLCRSCHSDIHKLTKM